MTINMTMLQNSQTTSDIVCFANSSTSGLLITGFLIAFFFIMLLVLKRWEFEKSLLVSSWSCFLLASIAAFGKCTDGSHFITPYVALVFLIIGALTALYIWTSGSD